MLSFATPSLVARRLYPQVLFAKVSFFTLPLTGAIVVEMLGFWLCMEFVGSDVER